MEFDDLLLEKEGHIAIVTLNAPDKINALTLKMRASLAKATDEIAKDDDVRVVIVTGAGRGFCAGADVNIMKDRMAGKIGTTIHEKLETLGKSFCTVFNTLEKPVISALHGVCVGGGMSLALSTDWRVAGEGCKFGAAQINRGLNADYGLTYYLPAMVGVSKALEIMMTGQIFDSAEALRLGLVDQVVPVDQVMKVAKEKAAKLAEQPPFAVSLTKKLVWRTINERIDRQLDLETYAFGICSQTEDHKESVKAFLEKRPQPPFLGK